MVETKRTDKNRLTHFRKAFLVNIACIRSNENGGIKIHQLESEGTSPSTCVRSLLLQLPAITFLHPRHRHPSQIEAANITSIP